MAQLPQSFDASQVSTESQFAALPNGDYPVTITDSEMKDTKDGTGQYLQLTLEVIDGPYKGRKLWDRLNLVNSNATAVEIAQRSLSQICHAVGELNLTDSAQLHNKPLVAKAVYRPASNGYDESNDIKEYKAYSSGGQQQQAAPAPAPAANAGESAPAPAGNKPAWA